MENLLAFKIKSSFAKFSPYVQTHKVFAVIAMYKQKAYCSTWHNFKNTFVDLHQHCSKHALLKSKSFGLEVIAATAKSLQSCLTLCDPIDGSPPGFPVPGILQARRLEWVALSFSNAWK